MIKYEKLDKNVTITSETLCCLNCQFCYIPNDFMIGLNKAEFYCNISKDKPLSGDVLSEPFNYYDKVEFEVQDRKWAEWSSQHLVSYNGVCDLFKVSK